MAEKGSEASEGAWSPLFSAGVGLSAIYCLGTVGLIVLRGTTLDELRELELNSVGDLLAGICAPLAFLWLVLAVLIQRRELELTRQEFRDNRMVTLLQADEARKQAEFIGEQVTILREQQLAESKARGDVLYRQRVESFTDDVQGHHVTLCYRRRLTDQADELYRFENLTASLLGLRVFIEGATASVRDKGKRGAIMPDSVIDSLIFGAFELREALNLASSISHDHATRAGVYDLIEAIDSYVAADTASSAEGI